MSIWCTVLVCVLTTACAFPRGNADGDLRFEAGTNETTRLVIVQTKLDENSNWDDQLDKYLSATQADKSFLNKVEELKKYASDAVQKNLTAIRANLAAIGMTKTIDIVWPGSGYAGVSGGGNYEVLALLEKQELLSIGKIMGASGGASSAFLALADSDLSSHTLLIYYMAYGKWGAQQPLGPVGQAWRETLLWKAIYRRLMKDPAVFKRIQSRALAVAMCGTGLSNSNSVWYEFKTPSQAEAAFYASGDASAGGFVVGTKIPDSSWAFPIGSKFGGGTCMDGGQVTYFPHSRNALMYYDNGLYVDYIMKNPDTDAIVTLFKRGVDQTIESLTSTSLGSKYIKVALPGSSGLVGKEQVSAIKLSTKCTDFFNLNMEKDHRQGC